jgi:cellobiose phosphorylase
MTPAPWSNIIANEHFGCICTEAGPGYTYYRNSRENKLTEWSNDPLLNKLPESIYFRDDATGTVFCPTTQPLRQKGPYRITHGFGYTTYQHDSCEIYQEMTIFVPLKASFKYILVTLMNQSDEEKKISSYYYADLVLGLNRERELPYIVTGFDENLRIIKAQNCFSRNYKGYTAFLYSEFPVASHTCSKNSFFRTGCCGAVPMALHTGRLDNESENPVNPCAVIHNCMTLAPGEKKTFCYMFGQEKDESKIEETVNKYGTTGRALHHLKKVRDYWQKELGVLKVNTRDSKMNYLLNGWLQYQALACRLRARSSFYQSGGAYGFRDQLQDSLAFVYTDPLITKKMIKKASGRQFPEGDVQHWWDDDTGIGVRTLISDDLLWLPYSLSEYIRATDDYALLDEVTRYIEMDKPEEGHHERYGKPESSDKTDSIYNHAKKAILKCLNLGIHGLPLIGSGDWNDGMNMVGPEGKGESVWLAFFLYEVMSGFVEIAKYQNDDEFTALLKDSIESLAGNIDRHCWDGQWFLRAFFDDGTPLGSRNSPECRIDAISQSWSVISGAAKSSKAYQAMKELFKYLVDDNERMILLLYPPFYRSRPNPGYIQGYLRGIRENGGQYTHGAIWAVAAAALLGMNNEAYTLYDYINPISHTSDMTWVSKYRLEPYVMAADIYYNKMQKGRGGWSWYTGSASWMYRVGIQTLLGFHKRGDRLYINPLMPSSWYKYSIEYRHGKSTYIIYVEVKISDNLGGRVMLLDGRTCRTDFVPLVDDGNTHEVRVII